MINLRPRHRTLLGLPFGPAPPLPPLSHASNRSNFSLTFFCSWGVLRTILPPPFFPNISVHRPPTLQGFATPVGLSPPATKTVLFRCAVLRNQSIFPFEPIRWFVSLLFPPLSQVLPLFPPRVGQYLVPASNFSWTHKISPPKAVWFT